MAVSRDETRENLLNAKLSEILHESGLHSRALQGLKTERGTLGEADLIVDVGGHCVAVECEIESKGDGGQTDADKRLPEGEPLEYEGKQILRVYALEYPKSLNETDEHTAYEMLSNTGRLFVKERAHRGRWSQGANFTAGSFARHVIDYWNRTDSGQELNDVVAEVASSIDAAAKNLKAHARIAGEAKSDPEATAALIWLNALMFQELLHENLDPVCLPAPHTGQPIPRPNRKHSPEETVDQWDAILEINWWPIFKSARDSLASTGQKGAELALDKLKKAAADISRKGVIEQHDIAGRIFHRLLATRKFLATNYTSIPAAILLAGLIFDPQHPSMSNLFEANLDAFLENTKTVDPACGSGTLLMASLQRMKELYETACDSPETEVFNLRMLQEKLCGFDVVPGAVHLAAATLSMSETSRLVSEMKLSVMNYGIDNNGTPRLGSLDMLAGSPSEGNAEQLPGLEGESGTEISGHGETDESSIKFPDSPAVIIANPPYTRAGGPGNEKWAGWNPIFGFLSDEADRKKMDESLNATLQRTCGNKLAGLGAAFFALADEKIPIDKRIGFVLPRTAMTGSSWAKVREALLSRYEIDWVIASHDTESHGKKNGVQGRCWWSFSESTNLNEVLVVATRRNAPESSHRIRFVNLTRNPRTPAEAKILLNRLLEHRQDETVTFGGILCGKTSHIQQSSLKENDLGRHVSYVNREIQEAAGDIASGRIAGKKISVAAFGDIWEIGPSDMSIKSVRTTEQGKQKPDAELVRLDSKDHQAPYWATEGYDRRLGRPAIWRHKTKQEHDENGNPKYSLVEKMSQTADATLEIKSSKLSADENGSSVSVDAERLWEQRSRFHVGTDVRLNACSVAAVITDIEMLGVRMWLSAKAKQRTEGAEEFTCLWLNSTLGLLARIASSNIPDPGRSSMKSSFLRKMPVADYSELSKEQLQQSVGAYRRLRNRKLRPIHKLNASKARKDIDTAIAEILEIPYETIETLAEILASEPCVHGGKQT